MTIGGHGLLETVTVAKAMTLALVSNVNLPPLRGLVKVNALVTAGVVRARLCVLVILGMRDSAKIFYAVVGLNSIDVINKFRQFAINVKPRQPVRKVLLPTNANDPITHAIEVAGDCTDTSLNVGFQPSKKTGFLIVRKIIFEKFLREFLHVSILGFR